MSRIITGLVVGSKNRGDANKVIELLTSENGTEYVFASGARRLTSRFLPLTKLFTLVSLECTQSGEMLILKDGKALGGFESIETDIDKFMLAADVIKSVRITSANSENKGKLYALCVAYFGLSDICKSSSTDEKLSAAVKFYIYLLCYLGYDVKAYAVEYGKNNALMRICEHLSGKALSQTMTSSSALERAAEAYGILADIYSEQLDIQLGGIYSNELL